MVKQEEINKILRENIRLELESIKDNVKAIEKETERHKDSLEYPLGDYGYISEKLNRIESEINSFRWFVKKNNEQQEKVRQC